MTDVLKMSRKALTVGVVLTTILWSMMATVLVAPLKASAAGCTSGTLIKGSLAAVYYCGADGKRYVFTNDKAYFTWYADFSGVTTISDADLASIQIGGNVTYRPGVKMLKIQSDPKVYAVAHGGTLRHVPSESCAVTLYGATWNQQIHDVSDAFFTNYTVGSAISASCNDYDKTAEMSGSQSVNQDKGLATGGVSGTASVSKASDSPAGASLPQGAMGVNFLKFNLTNNGSAMTVDSVTLRRVGPGAPGDISAVYLYEGSSRLTTGRSVNSSTNEVTFTGLNLSLGAGQTRTLWVAVDIAAQGTGNVHAFELKSAMSGTTMLSGSPFTGSNFTITGATVGSLTIAKTGTITNPKAGEMEAKIAEFTINAGSSEDVRLQRLTLFQNGNLSGGNLTNLKLKQAGLTIATATGFDANLRATFVLSAPGMLLEKGATKTYQVYGDIGGGARSNDTIRISTEEASDVYGVGQTFGYGTTVTRTAYDNSAGDGTDASWSTVEAGQLTLTFLGPASKDVSDNGNDLEVFRFSMVAQSNVEVRNLNMQIVGSDLINATPTPDVANFTDIKVTNVANSVTWWGPKDVSITGSDTTQALTFNDVQTLQAGVVYTFSVTVDSETGLADGATVRMDLNTFGTSDLRNLDNGTFLTPSSDVVPGSTLTGNTMTVREASLTISLGSTPVSQSFIKGTANVDFAGVNLKAGDSSNVTVTSLTARGWIDDAGTTILTQGFDSANSVEVRDVITTCRLMDGTTMLGTAKSPTSSTAEGSGGLLEYTGLNLTITAGQTKSLKVNCDISNSAYLNSNAERVGFSVQTAAEVVAQDPDGNAITPTGTANASATTVRHLIENAGTMSYTLAPDDTESEAGLVIAGNTVVLGKIRLTAASEELKQTKLRVSLLAANQSSVISMSLFDGATLVAGPVPLSATNADFSGFNFVVPKDGSKTLTVKAVLNTVSAGAASGADLQIEADTSNADGQSSFEYRGTSSSTVVTAQSTGADVAGNSKVIRKSKPTVSLASLQSLTLSNGTANLMRFTVTADSAEQISLKKLTFEVSINGTVTVSATGNSAINEVGGSPIAGQVSTTGTCNATGTCTIHSYFTSEQTIAAGTSKTYELMMDIANAATGESVSTKLLGDSTAVTGELDSSGATLLPELLSIDDLDDTDNTGTQRFVWSDNSAIPHNDTVNNDTAADGTGSNDWTNGRFVKVLPTASQSLTF